MDSSGGQEQVITRDPQYMEWKERVL